MGFLVTEIVKVNTSGEDGNAEGSAISRDINGWIESNCLAFHDSAPGATHDAVVYITYEMAT